MVSPLSWTAVPLFPIPAFVALVVLGWKHRRQAQAHKRLMLGAALIMMDPAIGRLPIMPPVIAGFAVLNLLSWLTFVPLFIWDKRTIGRLHWATKLGAAVFGAALILRLLALSTPHWERVAAYLPGL
jgi:hypothetical protein